MITIQEDIELKNFTTFRVGGKARYFTKAYSEEDIAEAIRWAKEKQVPVFVLGGGSNVLFSDKGWEGMVLKIENKEILNEEDGKLQVDAGTIFAHVVEFSRMHGFSGMEKLAGIPGTMGGAVRGNAGAFGMETKDSVQSVRAFNRETLVIHEYSKEECLFEYRSSFFKRHPEMIILSVKLSLQPGADSDELGKIMNETVETRKRKHPQKLFCAGSFFINPVVPNESIREEFERDTGIKMKGDMIPAGWLIDAVGLRGKEIGGAKVSDIHPNYLINTGVATAESIIILASIIKQRVRSELGIRLQEEVSMVGF